MTTEEPLTVRTEIHVSDDRSGKLWHIATHRDRANAMDDYDKFRRDLECLVGAAFEMGRELGK